MARRKAPLIPDALLDQLLAGRDPQSALGRDGLVDELKRALAERELNAEMAHHLGGEAAEGRSNSHNGYGRKTVLTETGKLPIAVPRDRLATFEPQLIAKYRRRLPVDQLCCPTDDKVISMYARGLSVSEIQSHLAELYGIDTLPELISAVIDAILDEIMQWQDRPLEAVYPLVFFDTLRVKIRDEGTVRNKAVYLALGVRADGRKEILDLWIEQTEGAKFWLRVMTELKNRGVEDILIAVVDGLKGFPDAITAVFPQAQVQTCIVHLIRNALNFVSYKDRRAVAAALKAVYKAKDADAATKALEAFAAGEWGRKYPAIALSWRRHWSAVIPFFAFPLDVRQVIYTTNASETLNARLRRTVRARGHFPSDEAAITLLYLVLNLVEDQWLEIHHTRLTEAGCSRPFEEKISCAAHQRPALERWAETTTPAGQMVLTMFAGVAEFERPQKLRPDQKTLALALVQEGRSINEVVQTFNVHPATIHRCLNAPQASERTL